MAAHNRMRDSKKQHFEIGIRMGACGTVAALAGTGAQTNSIQAHILLLIAPAY